MPALPPSFLFQVTSPLCKVDWPDGTPAEGLWNDLSPVVRSGDLDAERRPFSVRLGWSEEGLVVGAEVTGKHERPVDVLDDPNESDGLILCLDTRDTKSIRRAGRFCHRFRLHPGADVNEGTPWIRQEPVPRAREDARFAELPEFIRAETTQDGYRVLAAIPAANLTGFDPRNSPQLGFYAELRDAELGVWPWTGDRALPMDADPSLWGSVVLTED